jgi:hypothetical protein
MVGVEHARVCDAFVTNLCLSPGGGYSTGRVAAAASSWFAW